MTLVKHSDRTLRKPCQCHGTKELYWAHDTDVTSYPSTANGHRAGDPIPRCEKCNVTGHYVLMNMNGTRHEKTSPLPPAPAPGTPSPMPAPYPPSGSDSKPDGTNATPTAADNAASASILTGAVNAADGDMAKALSVLQGLFAPKIDQAEIERLVKLEVQNVAFPTRTVVQSATGETKEIPGNTHERLADVLLDLSIGENVLMVGSAGTGKSTIAKQAAKGLDTPYGEISLNPGLTATALLGYMNATGEYVRTVFREIWEHGGVFHADEFDNGHPSTLATLNAALACSKGDAIAFPDGMITRHDDFRFVASANTYGRGPDRVYVGRQQLDAATLDRFVVEEINVDESLEHAVCLATGYESEKVSEVIRYVRSLRRNAAEQKLTLIFSPRASIGMCRLLKAGKPLSAAIESRVRKGISDSDWSKVSNDVPTPYL